MSNFSNFRLLKDTIYSQVEIMGENDGKLVTRTTVKKKKQVMLPEVLTMIVQPNRITNMEYNYSLIQEKIFTLVLYYLQDSIFDLNKGVPNDQLSLFRNNEETIRLKIPLRQITKSKSSYQQVKDSVASLAGIVVRIPEISPLTGIKGISYEGLLRAFIPVDKKYSRDIEVTIRRDVAEMLITIDKNQYGQPKNYTRFALEICENAVCKYTPRIYKLISSWKSKGGFRIKLEDLKTRLMLGDKYPTYRDFKKYVLQPAQDELYEKADCWFNCSAEGFEERVNNKVIWLNFKVIVPGLVAAESDKNNVKYYLRTYGNFTDADFKKLGDRYVDLAKTVELLEYVRENSAKITSPRQYILKSLMKASPLESSDVLEEDEE